MDEGRGLSRVRVPRGMAERARELAEGGLSPAVPRDAATVILLRQAPGLEVFLLRRTRALEFAPGACVFPGGSVDDRDADPAIGQTAWAGPSAADLGDQLGISADRARALVCAAVRETFEESGVLLAGSSPTDLVRDGGLLAEDRHRLLDGSVSLGGLLSRRRLVLRADLLTPWARWITPEVSPRRFDTWFFAAALPPGQTAALAGASGPEAGSGPQAQPAPGESDSGTWLAPAAALEAARAGQITLLPPTAVTLAELAAHQDVASILAQRRTITPLLPRVIVEDERAWLAMPQAIQYPL
jgi:8-oxo-dGTP pyrophosphatase MutT (NUDIX family)